MVSEQKIQDEETDSRQEPGATDNHATTPASPTPLSEKDLRASTRQGRKAMPFLRISQRNPFVLFSRAILTDALLHVAIFLHFRATTNTAAATDVRQRWSPASSGTSLCYEQRQHGPRVRLSPKPSNSLVWSVRNNFAAKLHR